MSKLAVNVAAATLVLSSLALAGSARADTVKARCDVFPKGEDRATSSALCTFSQRQGVVGIQLESGQRYELVPVGDQPSAYRDQDGREAFRELGLGDRGQIYRLATESIFVYWDTAPFGSSATPKPLAGAAGASGLKPEFWVVTSGTTFIKARPGILSKTVSHDLAGGTVLRNLGCQSKQMPTWCNIEVRDNPQIRGWVWSPTIKAFRPEVGTTVAGLSDLVGSRAGQAENTILQRGYTFLRSAPSGDAVFSYWREAKTNRCVIIRTADGRYASIVYGSQSCD